MVVNIFKVLDKWNFVKKYFFLNCKRALVNLSKRVYTKISTGQIAPVFELEEPILITAYLWILRHQIYM